MDTVACKSGRVRGDGGAGAGQVRGGGGAGAWRLRGGCGTGAGHEPHSRHLPARAAHFFFLRLKKQQHLEYTDCLHDDLKESARL